VVVAGYFLLKISRYRAEEGLRFFVLVGEFSASKDSIPAGFRVSGGRCSCDVLRCEFRRPGLIFNFEVELSHDRAGEKRRAALAPHNF
jgi:hypothetical protein